MEEVFDPVTENQNKNQIQTKLEAGRQIQTLRESIQTTIQVIEIQTRAIQHSSAILIEIFQISLKEGIQEYDEITNRNNQLLTKLVTSNQVNSSIIKTVLTYLKKKTKVNSV